MFRTIALALLILLAQADLSRADTMTFGVVPQQSASRLARVWLPVLADLTKDTGIQFKFATAKDIPTFEACLAKGAYDIAYMNPYHYVVFHDLSGYQAIAKQSKKKLKGILVTRMDSPIQGLNDLDSQRLAFPSPAAFGASVLPRAEMSARGIAFTPVYVKSHDSVYRAVADGLLPAGGGVLRTWNTVASDVRAKLRIFYETDGYTPHAFAVKSGLPDEARAKVSASLHTLSQRNPKALKALGMTGIDVSSDKDWDDVRSLGLSKSQTKVVDAAAGTCPSD